MINHSIERVRKFSYDFDDDEEKTVFDVDLIYEEADTLYKYMKPVRVAVATNWLIDDDMLAEIEAQEIKDQADMLNERDRVVASQLRDEEIMAEQLALEASELNIKEAEYSVRTTDNLEDRFEEYYGKRKCVLDEVELEGGVARYKPLCNGDIRLMRDQEYLCCQMLDGIQCFLIIYNQAQYIRVRNDTYWCGMSPSDADYVFDATVMFSANEPKIVIRDLAWTDSGVQESTLYTRLRIIQSLKVELWCGVMIQEYFPIGCCMANYNKYGYIFSPALRPYRFDYNNDMYGWREEGEPLRVEVYRKENGDLTWGVIDINDLFVSRRFEIEGFKEGNESDVYELSCIGYLNGEWKRGRRRIDADCGTVRDYRHFLKRKYILPSGLFSRLGRFRFFVKGHYLFSYRPLKNFVPVHVRREKNGRMQVAVIYFNRDTGSWARFAAAYCNKHGKVQCEISLRRKADNGMWLITK